MIDYCPSCNDVNPNFELIWLGIDEIPPFKSMWYAVVYACGCGAVTHGADIENSKFPTKAPLKAKE
jgi:hypothetical protein